MSYLFGDNERAARRLRELARVFRPATEGLLEAARERLTAEPEAVSVDLGCGPGHTTRLLADVFGRPAIGLDSSEALLWEARRLGPERVSFRLHDVTAGRFPTPPAAVIFARFLLSHLENPAALARRWVEQLAPGGLVILDEVEDIEVPIPPFRLYLDLVAASLAARGTALYVGPRLAAELADDDLERPIDEVRGFEVGAADAARLFALNLPTLREAPEVVRNWDSTTLDALQDDLDLLAYDGRPEPPAVWRLRQMAVRRAAIEGPRHGGRLR